MLLLREDFHRNKLHYLTLIAITILVITIRLNYLPRAMRYDEAFSFNNYASQPLSVLLTDYSFPNNHIFHTLLVHISYHLFGNSPAAIRLPAFIAGVLLIAATYIVTRMFYKRNAALLSAVLVGISVPLINYSVNARGYTLVALIFISLLGLGKYLKQHNRLGVWLTFGVLSAFGFYTIPTMLFPMGIVGLWLLSSLWLEHTGRERWQYLRNFFIALALGAVLTMLLYLPVILHSGLNALVANEWVTSANPITAHLKLSAIPTMITRYINESLPFFVTWALVGGILLSCILHRRLTSDRVPLIMPALLWIGLVLAFRQVVPFERVWTYLVPLYMMLAAAGLTYAFDFITRRWQHQTLLFAAAGYILAGGLSFVVLRSECLSDSTETGYVPEAEQIALQITDDIQPGEKILASQLPGATVQYYLSYYGFDAPYTLKDEFSATSDYASEIESERLLLLVEPINDVTELYTRFPGILPPQSNLELVKLHTFDTLEVYTLTANSP